MSLDVHFSEPEEFNCTELHSCIEDVAKLLGIDGFEYSVDIISGKGDNYVANIFEVVIKAIDNENNSVKVIVKTLVNTERRETFRDFHKREVIVYNEIIPKYKELQTEIQVNKRIRFPECLYTNAGKNKEVIILKDLRDIGFGIDNIITKFDEPSFKQAELILTELAKFHALSFIYENKDKDNFDIVKLKLDDFLFQERFLSKTKLTNYFFDSYDMSLKMVTDVEAKKKLDRICDKLLEILRMYSKPSKYNVLCHGDLWINNILFKQGNKDEICFLDFQVSRYCCPVIDIIHFIYLTTTSRFRSDYFIELQNAYYESLGSYLKLFDIEVDSVYPREEFEKDLVEHLPYGLIEAMLELRIVTAPSLEEQESFDDSDEIDDVSSEIPTNLLYEFRVNDVVQESVSNGVLEKLLKLVDKDDI